MKSQIFLGSSSEGLKFVDRVKDILEPVGECISWTTSFTQNRSALDSLIKKTKLSDFAILIATKDDLTLKRDVIKSTPRDNIVFEFGLFMGATGLERAFLLAEEGAELPSDLEGITLGWFSEDPDKHNYLDKVCKKIVEHIITVQQSSYLGLLPSTALALGYYHSFVKGVCEQIRENNVIKSSSRDLRIKSFELHVIIPEQLDSNGVTDFRLEYNKMHSLDGANTVPSSTSGRGYPFHFKIDPIDQDTGGEIEVKMFDIPTTLNTILESIKLYLPATTVGSNRDSEYLERRELENFGKVLKFLVSKNSLTKNTVFITDSVVL